MIGNDEIYYQPIEIITLWGTVTRTSKANKLALGVSSIILCLCLCLCFRRCQKKSSGYGELPEGGDAFDYWLFANNNITYFVKLKKIYQGYFFKSVLNE